MKTGKTRLDRIYQLTELIRTKSNFDYGLTVSATNKNEHCNHQGVSDINCSHNLVSDQDSNPVTPLVTPLATPLARLIQVLGNDEKGIMQLSEDLAITDKKHIRKTYITPALEQELIEMTIPDKTTSPNQKYRLTEKGKQHLIKGKQK